MTAIPLGKKIMDNNKFSKGKVRIVLKGDKEFTYVGNIVEEGETFIRIIDKYDKRVFLLMSEIKVIQEIEE